MSDDWLKTEIADGIARMTINRPEARNAMTGGLIKQMTSFVRSIEGNPQVRALLISGTGEHFMAGGDVKSMTSILSEPKDAIRADLEQRSVDAGSLWVTLERMQQPVICKARGFTAGVAISFVAGADIAICSESAQFLLAHVGIGLVADGATSYHLPRTVGIRKAKEMAFFGDRIDAATALQIGLVTRVVADDDLDDAVEQVLKRIAVAPAVSLAQAKALMNASLGNSIDDQLAMEGRAVGACGASDDFAEGVTAFVEKRKPQFTGK